MNFLITFAIPNFEYHAKNKDALTCKEDVQGYRYWQDTQVQGF